MEGLDAMDELEPLVKARLLSEAIASCLPDSIAAAALPLQSKIPFKVLSLRETLFHRASALASPAVALLEAGNWVSGILLTRAVMETTGLIAVLGYEITKFVETFDTQRFDTFLIRCLLANRRDTGGMEDKFPAESILKFIDKVDKKNKGFRATYNELCEYAHPNYDGVLGSFGNVNRATFVLTLGPNSTNGVVVGANALSRSLDILVRSYDGMADGMNAANRHFDASWRESSNE